MTDFKDAVPEGYRLLATDEWASDHTDVVWVLTSSASRTKVYTAAVPKTYTFELNQRQAEMLKAIIGKNTDSDLFDLYRALPSTDLRAVESRYLDRNIPSYKVV